MTRWAANVRGRRETLHGSGQETARRACRLSWTGQVVAITEDAGLDFEFVFAEFHRFLYNDGIWKRIGNNLGVFAVHDECRCLV